MEARNSRLWVAWVWLATSQVPLCGCFMLHPRQAASARPHHKPAEFYRFAANPQMRCSSLRNLNPLLPQPQAHLPPRPAAGQAPPARRNTNRPTDLLLLAARGKGRISAVTWLSGRVDDTPDNGNGGTAADGSHTSGTATGVATGDDTAGGVQAETERLMSVPTIDIKLELQMRGVEHRDAFEKLELARRLAQARVSSPSPPPPAAAAAAATTATGDSDGDNRAAARETADDNKAPSTTTVGDGSGGGFSEGRRDSAAAPEGGGSAAYARDVAKATRMGKAAVVRELNAMGVAHSRLSEVSVLARQYASGRKQAREDAEQARRMPRAVRPSRQNDVGSYGGDTAGLSQGEEEGEGSGWRGSKEGGEDEPWSNAQGKYGFGASGVPWTVDEEEEDEDYEDEETDGASRTPAGGAGGRSTWKVSDDRSAAAPFSGEGGDVGDEHETTSWSVDANARSVASSASAGSRTTAAAGGVDKRRSRTVSLHARADRMSSRGLMKALDDLGARYRIPAPRSELQQAFVAAVLAQDGGSTTAEGGGKNGGENSGIVPLSPYATSAEEEGRGGEGSRQNTAAGFGTYHSALRWARQLTFDDVLEELKYRGVAFDPRADYSYLTRVLADEVLADEELMVEEGAEGAYAAELETAMAMTAQELIRDLRAGGEKADVTLTKEALAEKLAEMNLRLRDTPLPESGSSDAYQRRKTHPPRDRRRNAVADGGRRGRRDPADSPLGVGGAGSDDVLLELEEAARSVGGAALHVARETAAFVAETAAGLFPETFPANGSGGKGGGTPEEQRRWQRRRTEMGQAGEGADYGGGGGGASGAERARRARAVRERASGVGKAASGFAQSSVNRAGFAVAQSLANGLLRGAEAAADWAGDGALAREYVLLFIAAFCLVFKRGVGAAVALLIVIRFGRSAAQKLVLEGWKMERRANKRRGGGGVAAASATSSSRRRDSPSARYGAAPAAGRRPRRGKAAAAAAAEAEERRRPRRKTGRVKQSSGRSKRSKKRARRPLWDSESDDDNRGCVVM